jgi:acyl-CoA synthetase (AMP-forming)/AMP-acid ligase II
MLPLAACRAVGSAFIGTIAFDAKQALQVLEAERATIAYPVFPTITTALITHPDFAGRDLSSIRVVIDVGPADLLRRYIAAIPQAIHVNCYGLTEATGVPFYSELSDSDEERLESCGRPFTGVEVRIVDPETGEDAPTGEAGEIWLRGPCNFEGYYNDPDRTDEVFAGGGWLKTGDRGKLKPSGHLCYTGRFKDMLKIGGENVAAQEIENFLSTHPAVQIVQIVGVPDDHLQEVAAAFVELRPDAQVQPEELVAYCAGKIATYKIPRYVRFVSEWPLSSTKIQKFKLRDGFVPDGKLDVRAIVRRQSAA